MIQTWRITATEQTIINLPAVSLDELTRQLPDGYYSTFRTYHGGTRVLGLSLHFRRLYEPVSSPEVAAEALRQHLRALLKPYHPGEARVRLVMTKQGEAYIAIETLKELPRAIYDNGVRVETTELQRHHPRLKSTTFIARSALERNHIASEGIFEALLVKNGEILEGMTSNFFYIPHSDPRGGILCTARNNILLGVTRETVIKVARGQGLEIRYEPLKRDQLFSVAEAFITSSTRGIVPVVQIDEVTIGQGRPGVMTRELMSAYRRYVLEKSETI